MMDGRERIVRGQRVLGGRVTDEEDISLTELFNRSTISIYGKGVARRPFPDVTVRSSVKIN
jgi:hypothetical protein